MAWVRRREWEGKASRTGESRANGRRSDGIAHGFHRDGGARGSQMVRPGEGGGYGNGKRENDLGLGGGVVRLDAGPLYVGGRRDTKVCPDRDLRALDLRIQERCEKTTHARVVHMCTHTTSHLLPSTSHLDFTPLPRHPAPPKTDICSKSPSLDTVRPPPPASTSPSPARPTRS